MLNRNATFDTNQTISGPWNWRLNIVYWKLNISYRFEIKAEFLKSSIFNRKYSIIYGLTIFARDVNYLQSRRDRPGLIKYHSTRS